MGIIEVLVVGCNGAMGRIVSDQISKSSDMLVYAGFDAMAAKLPDFPNILTTTDDLEDYIDENNKPDVIIDFSQHDNTINVLEKISLPYCIPTVVATTGFSPEQNAEIEKMAEDVPIFKSSNMSYEIKVLCDLLKEVAPRLYGTHDIEIEETHHNRKKDAPSGTAKTLAEAINESLGGKMNIVYGREGKRETDEIGVASLRGGNVVGVHTIHFFGQSDELEITHRAYSREMFAEGALKAARFIIDQPCGRVYGMDDLQ